MTGCRPGRSSGTWVQRPELVNTANVPIATYRVQFSRNFTFRDATNIIPYLRTLGISHVYASPFLKARVGSPHGYDIVDHNALNPEIGDERSFRVFIDTLHDHHMQLILDIVPNHMGVGGDDNHWWLDVLENGEASPFSAYFDIDWHPANTVLHNKVLLPFLGDHYGTVLENGELKLVFDADKISFGIRYYEHLFPLDPRTWPQIIGLRMDELRMLLARDDFNRLRMLVAGFQSLPPRTDLSADACQQRQQSVTENRRRLADLYLRSTVLRDFLNENIASFNGDPDHPESFDSLDELIEAQAWRLAYWQVAADEINYRRFFDINELAGIRVDRDEVFQATHELVRQFIDEGAVNGLRVDHPDGLTDPHKYLSDLQGLAGESSRTDEPFYIAVEKILMEYEWLPRDWPVAGTTGYDASALLNGLFVHPDAEIQLTRQYHRLMKRNITYDDLLYECKKLIIRTTLSSELTVLTNLLDRIAQADRHSRDFTHQGLRNALAEVVACFPVYRTYNTPPHLGEEDRRYIQWALVLAKKRNPANDVLIFDFIEKLLTGESYSQYGPDMQRNIFHFTLRFQQYTAPVMAKGSEDTAFYIYSRLVSLNEVGSMPGTFNTSVNAFHQANKLRLTNLPYAMVCTSTHDSKRSEDVRMRINVISELPDLWRRHVGRWNRVNRRKKSLVNDELAPSRNDEYLLYQTLLGTYPLGLSDGDDLTQFRERIEAYMLKAVREAKVHTSWINPNSEYERAVQHFVSTILDNTRNNAFLADFVDFQRRLARFGLLNSLSQTMLKMTMPGIPDIYQGNEQWVFHLVDPDNRRSVDFERYERSMHTLTVRIESGDPLAGLARDLIENIEDGAAKLYLIKQTLALRNHDPQLFNNGEYMPLATEGTKADNLCAFMRRFQGRAVIVVATRWFAGLLGDNESSPLNSVMWGDTVIVIPDTNVPAAWRNVLTNEQVEVVERDDRLFLSAAELLQSFTVAVLVNSADYEP